MAIKKHQGRGRRSGGGLPRAVRERLGRVVSQKSETHQSIADKVSQYDRTSRQTVSKWFRAKPDDPSAAKLWALARATGWSLDYLFFGEGRLERGVSAERAELGADLRKLVEVALGQEGDLVGRLRREPRDFLPPAEDVLGLAVAAAAERARIAWEQWAEGLRQRGLSWIGKVRSGALSLTERHRQFLSDWERALLTASLKDIAQGFILAPQRSFLALPLPEPDRSDAGDPLLEAETTGRFPEVVAHVQTYASMHFAQAAIGPVFPGQPWAAYLMIKSRAGQLEDRWTAWSRTDSLSLVVEARPGGEVLRMPLAQISPGEFVGKSSARQTSRLAGHARLVARLEVGDSTASISMIKRSPEDTEDWSVELTVLHTLPNSLPKLPKTRGQTGTNARGRKRAT